MRGKALQQATMLMAVTLDALVPKCHPIRRIKPMVDRALVDQQRRNDGLIPLPFCSRPRGQRNAWEPRPLRPLIISKISDY